MKPGDTIRVTRQMPLPSRQGEGQIVRPSDHETENRQGRGEEEGFYAGHGLSFQESDL